MTDHIQHVIDHFPDHEETIRELGGSHAGFNATCQAFSAAHAELSALEGSTKADASLRAEQARRRCADLETELLAMVQQNMRV